MNKFHTSDKRTRYVNLCVRNRFKIRVNLLQEYSFMLATSNSQTTNGLLNYFQLSFVGVKRCKKKLFRRLHKVFFCETYFSYLILH